MMKILTRWQVSGGPWSTEAWIVLFSFLMDCTPPIPSGAGERLRLRHGKSQTCVVRDSASQMRVQDWLTDILVGPRTEGHPGMWEFQCCNRDSFREVGRLHHPKGRDCCITAPRESHTQGRFRVSVVHLGRPGWKEDSVHGDSWLMDWLH